MRAYLVGDCYYSCLIEVRNGGTERLNNPPSATPLVGTQLGLQQSAFKVCVHSVVLRCH